MGFKSLIFQPMRPWNLMDDLEKKPWALFLYYIKLCAWFESHRWIQTEVTVRKRSIRVKIGNFFPMWPSNLTDDLEKQQGTTSIIHQIFCIISKPSVTVWKHSIQVKIGDFFVLCDLEIWQMTFKNNRAPLLYYVKLCASFQSHQWFQTGVTVWKHSIPVKSSNFLVHVTQEIW